MNGKAYFIGYAERPSVAAPTVGSAACGEIGDFMLCDWEWYKALETKMGASGALHGVTGLSGVNQLSSVVDVSGMRFIASH